MPSCFWDEGNNMSDWQVIQGDCLDVLRSMAANSIDAIVTDPPYGLSFMGKKWDYDVPAVEVWAECLRVLKPGGHLLAFAGTRTQHRMAVRIEDAGFEIRDMIAWVYGSGFPKSLDVSKAIDKVNGETGRLHKFTGWMRTTGVTAKQINDATGTFMASHYLTAGSQPAIPTPELWAVIRPMCGDVPAWVDMLVERVAAEREVVGVSPHSANRTQSAGSTTFVGADGEGERYITAPATDAARQWSGWGTALKPALEPITMARKPFASTVAANVAQWGTGAINVDGCRVPAPENVGVTWTRGGNQAGASLTTNTTGVHQLVEANPLGRWPANLIHDGSDEVVGGFPNSGNGQGKPTVAKRRLFYSPKASKAERDAGCEGLPYGDPPASARSVPAEGRSNALGEPRRNHHPTVKPAALMAYLCRLVTPPGGTILDPFNGSGSTGIGAIREGFNYIGIEREAEYVEIARKRIGHEAASHLYQGTP